jgi:hypothetical protein
MRKVSQVLFHIHPQRIKFLPRSISNHLSHQQSSSYPHRGPAPISLPRLIFSFRVFRDYTSVTRHLVYLHRRVA